MEFSTEYSDEEMEDKEFRNTSPVEEWIRKDFFYLEDRYQFRYNGFINYQFEFASPKVSIRIEVGHRMPRIYILRVGEPEFVLVSLHWIIQYYTNSLPFEHIDFQSKTLRENISFFADVIEKHADKITLEIDAWWLPVNKFIYKTLEKEYSDSGQLDDFVSSYKKFHDYLKSKGAI